MSRLLFETVEIMYTVVIYNFVSLFKKFKAAKMIKMFVKRILNFKIVLLTHLF